ncbi:uncharacterized protein DS421_1g11670 [Arachis hypogaea]|nr:uncharacterized protein DS421_1g11670 [Arachis hypogaea]
MTIIAANQEGSWQRCVAVRNPRVEFGSAPTKSGSTAEKYQGRTHPETPNFSSFPLSSTIPEAHTLPCRVAQLPSRPVPWHWSVLTL